MVAAVTCTTPLCSFEQVEEPEHIRLGLMTLVNSAMTLDRAGHDKMYCGEWQEKEEDVTKVVGQIQPCEVVSTGLGP